MYNRKATFDYQLLDNFTAGIILNGKEVKAIREDKASFGDSYCFIINNEIFLKKFHISVKDGEEKDTLRDRKLLLNKKEILKISKAIKEKGLTVIPLSLYINKTGLIKLEIYLAKGKNEKNKKEKLKEKDLKRELSYNL